MAEHLQQQVASLQTLLKDKTNEVDAYKSAIEQSDQLLQQLESGSSEAIEITKNENLDLRN